MFADDYLIDQIEAEEIALEHNQKIKALRNLYRQAKEGRFESISNWLPEISALSQLYVNRDVQVFRNSKRTFATQLSLTQAIFSSDKLFDVRLASLQMEHMALLLEALENDILYEVRSLYYQLALDYERLKIAQEHVEIFTRLSEQLASQYAIGTQTILNVNQSKVAIANATTTYYQRVRQLKSDLDAFIEVLGYMPGEIDLTIADEAIDLQAIGEIYEKLSGVEAIFNEEGEGSPIYQAGFPQTQVAAMNHIYSYREIERWEEIAQGNNPFLKSRLNEVAIADQQVKKRVGEYFPEINFTANFGGEPNPFNEYPSSTIGSQEFQWGAGIEVKWLLFDSLGRESRVQQSRHGRSAKMNEYTHMKQSTMRETRQQIYEIEASIASYVTSKGNVLLAQQTLEQAGDQFEIGTITIYDLQVAVDGLIEAKNRAAESAYDLVHAYYGLRHVSGIDMQGINNEY